MKQRVPTYAEATSEDHPTGHEPTWEVSASGDIACSLCGWSYRLT